MSDLKRTCVDCGHVLTAESRRDLIFRILQHRHTDGRCAERFCDGQHPGSPVRP